MVKMYFTPTEVNTFFLKKSFFNKLKIYPLEDFRQGVSSLGPLTAHTGFSQGPKGFEFASFLQRACELITETTIAHWHYDRNTQRVAAGGEQTLSHPL